MKTEEFQIHGGDLPPLLLQSNSEGMAVGEATGKIYLKKKLFSLRNAFRQLQKVILRVKT